MSGLDLARLALRAEEHSAALVAEHRAPDGSLPAHVLRRSVAFERLSDLLAHLARPVG